MAHLSVLDYARRFADTHGYVVTLTAQVQVGIMEIHPDQRTIQVHPDSADLTLQMNTAQGQLLPSSYTQRRTAA